MKELRIELVQDHPNQPFCSGRSISGRIVVVVDKPKSYKDISIQFFGIAKVQWSKVENNGNTTSDVKYWSKQVLVDVKRSLWTADQSPDGLLPPGENTYSFCLDIPYNAPSSFEGTVGSIRYELLVRIEKGEATLDHVFRRSVPIQQVVDMSDPSLLLPVRQEVQKNVCCLWCASAPIVLTVTLPKQGYCIGETLPIHVTIENGSSRRVKLKASLDQSVEYIAGDVFDQRTRTSNTTLLCIRRDEIAPHNTRNWGPCTSNSFN